MRGMMTKPMGAWTMQDMMQMMHGSGMHAGGLANVSGREFDPAVARQMIQHHRDVIAPSEQLAGSAQDPKVRAWAVGIVKSQRTEIQQLRELPEALDASTNAGQTG
ncbi:DUF305 domain-containing protein [Deinococcus peraridilitoris]|uniref:DUF305 domain-containing protein n=1 Tax=Deinococcus peraridilitoris TaxID=432329 RepID=UPI0012FACCE6|nr:DUF305 domain-containing protein [Deinococcus peraridilitoris]